MKAKWRWKHRCQILGLKDWDSYLSACPYLSSYRDPPASVPSCLPSCSSCHRALLEGTSSVTASRDRVLSPRPTSPLLVLGPASNAAAAILQPRARSTISSASRTQRPLINTGKACCICLTRVFRWQTSPLRKIYQTEMRYITEFLQSKAVTSVSQSAEC